MPVLHTDSTYTILLVSYVHTCSTWCYLSVFFACFVLTGSSITDHPIRFCSENNVLCTLVRLLVLTGFDFFSSAVCVKFVLLKLAIFPPAAPSAPSVRRSPGRSVRPSVRPSIRRFVDTVRPLSLLLAPSFLFSIFLFFTVGFSFAHRRFDVFPFSAGQHHCRACGRLYCYACSRFRALLPRSFGTRDPQRLCQPCNARVAPLQEMLAGKAFFEEGGLGRGRGLGPHTVGNCNTR